MAEQNSSISITWAGETWLLDKRRVLINQEKKLLILSDIHIGYYSSFRAKGSYLPAYDSLLLEETIESLLGDYIGYHWIIAGDLKHNHSKNISEGEQRELYVVLSEITKTNSLTILLGNHDKGLEDIIKDLKISCTVKEELKFDRFIVTHNQEFLTEEQNQKYIIGHVHPIISVDAVKGLFIPVFALSDNILILPAFNYVAGGFNMKKLILQQNFERQYIIYAIRNKIYDLGLLDYIPS